MTRFVIALSVATFIGFGTENKAQAQLTYGYTVPSYSLSGAYTGTESQYTSYSPFGSTTTSSFYSPYTGLTKETTGSYYTPYGGTKTFTSYSTPYGSYHQSYTTNAYGAGSYNTSFYNPYTGYRYGTTVYQPNAYMYPYLGYTSSYVRHK